MSGYLIAFIPAVVLDIAFLVAICYFKYCQGKRYELLSGISEILAIAVLLTFGYWFLERFYSGFDSGFGQWLFAFALGGAISICISLATNHICNMIWFKGEDVMITKVKVRKGLKIAIYILTFICCLGFNIFLIYCLIAKKFEDIGEMIIAILVIALFTFGSYYRIKEIMKLCKK